MTANDPADVAAQYATAEHLRTRTGIHDRYTSGPELEASLNELLALRDAESLLDVGTGPGDFPGRLRAAGHTGRLVGVDLSAGMVEAARAKHVEVEFVQASADQLPFADAGFDVLTARHMLYHVPNVPDALAEFRRVLKPGGRFLAVTNAVGYMGELWAAVAEAATLEPALTPLAGSRKSFADAFSESNGAVWVRQAFGNAAVTMLDSALVFPTPEPVLDYLASLPLWIRLSEAEKLNGRAALEAILAGKFRNGSWAVSKRLAFIAAAR